MTVKPPEEPPPQQQRPPAPIPTPPFIPPDPSRSRRINVSIETPAPPAADYYSDEIIIYGVRLDYDHTADSKIKIKLPFERTTLKLTVKQKRKNAAPADPEDNLPIVAAYGYAFEGYCYRFDRPRVLILEPEVLDGEPAKGCGFGGYETTVENPGPPPTKTLVPGYTMWRIRKGASVVDMTIAIGSAEDLILDQNLPGNRAPNTYGNSMAMGHRGKKLTGIGNT